MSEENVAEKRESETPADPAPEEKTNVDLPKATSDDTDGSQDSDKSKGEKTSDEKEDIMIPKARFDEESRKRQDLESKYKILEDSNSKITSKLDAIADGIRGKEPDEKDEAVQKLATEYDVPQKFVEDMLTVAEERIEKKLAPQLNLAKQTSASAVYTRELEDLTEKLPESSEMSSDDKKELRSMAHKPENLKVPLIQLYKSMMYDKPESHGQTAEGTSGRRGGFAQEANISNMSIEEFKKWSDDMAKNEG